MHIEKLTEKNVSLAGGNSDRSNTPQAWAKAEQCWRRAYDRADSQCAHHNCHVDDDLECTYGKRKRVEIVLNGAILSIWGVLQEQFFRGKVREMKIVRMVTDAGERVVGLRIPQVDLLDRIRKAIKADATLGKLSAPASALADISLESNVSRQSNRPGAAGGGLRRKRPSQVGAGPANAKVTSNTRSSGHAKRSKTLPGTAGCGPIAAPDDDDMAEDASRESDGESEEDGAEEADEDSTFTALDDSGMVENINPNDDTCIFTIGTTSLAAKDNDSQQQSLDVEAADSGEADGAVIEADEDDDDGGQEQVTNVSVNSAQDAELVSKSIEVEFDDPNGSDGAKRWYTGRVKQFDGAKDRWLIVWEDGGEEEWVNVSDGEYRLADPGSTAGGSMDGADEELPQSDEDVKAAGNSDLGGSAGGKGDRFPSLHR